MPGDPNKLSRFWQELKRRKVIHVIVVYASAAYVIIELVGNTYEAMNLPDWTPAFAIIVLSIGFPLAVIFSWIYDISSKGIAKTEKKVPADQATRLKNSIAVLPFQDMSQTGDQEYFCDGIAEEIINALAHVSGLTVIARTSSFSFRNQNLDIRKIGQKLNVETLLEGSIRKESKRLRISVQLINSIDGSHIWSERFDRNLEDIFSIQDEISMAVMDNLKIKLLGEEKSVLLKRYTNDFEVYDLYLKALSNIQLATYEGFEKTTEYIGKALKMDPLFVPGYHGLAEMYMLSSFFGKVPPNIGFPKAKEYAERALEIDDKFSDGHRIMGVVSIYYDWDWAAAEHHLKNALKLNPSNEWIHYSYSLFLSFMGRHTESISHAKQIVELDPLSGYFNAHLGLMFTYALRLEEAINHLKQTLTTFPNSHLGHFFLGMAYRSASKMDEAIKEYYIAKELSNGVPIVIAFLAYALYETGRKDEAERLLNSLEKRSKEVYVPAMCFFGYYLLQSDHDRAYKYLEQAIREHDGYLFHYYVTPIIEYRIPTSEPRFADLLKKAGLDLFLKNEEL